MLLLTVRMAVRMYVGPFSLRMDGRFGPIRSDDALRTQPNPTQIRRRGRGGRNKKKKGKKVHVAPASYFNSAGVCGG